MNGITAVTPYSPDPAFHMTLSSLKEAPQVAQLIVIHDHASEGPLPECDTRIVGPLFSGKTLHAVLTAVKENLLLLIHKHDGGIRFLPHGLDRFVEVAESTGGGILYSDYCEYRHEQRVDCPLTDYQDGSVRDDFDFGPVMVFSVPAVRSTVEKFGLASESQYSALYELRLKLAMEHPLIHLQEALYTVQIPARSARTDRSFDYVDPSNHSLQKEREAVFTDYLKRTGAYLKTRSKGARPSDHPFPVEASVIIPVRNRKEKVVEAAASALGQKTDFPYNIIVVDNHSTDGTTEAIAGMAERNPATVHIIPERFDLGIGGCWNEAIYSQACGRYAVQLDSDDLYISTDVLQRIIDYLRKGRYAMAVGAYTLVDSNGTVIPPGIVDHREWTQNNGHNNLLRVNGIGAPRAFDTAILRTIGFPNVSYGEDYAVSLRISREWRIGRIFESLYLCRRWGDNTDASLSTEQSNRNHAFKDKLRTIEIMARRNLNKSKHYEKRRP